jgi:hypothetical protein
LHRRIERTSSSIERPCSAARILIRAFKSSSRFLIVMLAIGTAFRMHSHQWKIDGDCCLLIRTPIKIALSARDWDAFYDALLNPPEPNEKLIEAARRYRERVGG